MTEEEQKETLALMVDRLLNDATWGMQTHFAAQQDKLEALQRKIDLQTKLFKELWDRMKVLEQKNG